jgi:hypothetical protein
LKIERSGILAYGRDTAEGFIVEAGSTARVAEVPSMHSYMSAIRKKLIEDGLLVLDGKVYRLTHNFAFKAPSTAAGVLLARSASGRIEWHDEDGQTLKQLQEAVAN